MADTVLSARNLIKDYTTGSDTVRALDGVTLDVPRGRFLAVMGPSGSGKSTLLHLLGGLDTPTSGNVMIEGRELGALGDRERTLARRTRIGFVFQFFNLIPVLSVEENIGLPLVIAGTPARDVRARVERALDLVGLTDRRSHLPSEISGGQQQRAAVARALVSDPAVVLADEPTGNLDQRTSSEVLDLLARANRELGQTTVIVTHDSRAAGFADEVVLLVDGQITSRLVLDETTGAAPAGGDHRAQAVLAWLQASGA